MAYAGIVGVPPIMGLYTIVPPLIAYALLGTSRLLVVGPDTATGLISALTVGAIATQGTAEFNALTSTLAFLTPRASRRFRPGSQDLDRCSRPSRSGDHRSHDSSLEGDGFEPSVPRHNKLCVAPATNVPGRDDPLRRQLGSGCKAELDQPTTLRRVRLARNRV